jgi:hypothetical protein
MTRERNEFISGKRRTEEIIVGACDGNENPDLWFPELGRGGDGRSDARLVRKAKEVDLALAICKSCDKKAECLNEGMRPENINYGIWGGLMAGERLNKIGVKIGDYHPFSDAGLALHFAYRITPYLRG